MSAIQERTVIFFWPNFVKPHRTSKAPRPALEQDKFLSGVKYVHILQFTRHNLKKTFLSAATITKLKIWQRQFLLRFWVEPNKFCLSAYCICPSVNWICLKTLTKASSNSTTLQYSWNTDRFASGNILRLRMVLKIKQTKQAKYLNIKVSSEGLPWSPCSLCLCSLDPEILPNLFSALLSLKWFMFPCCRLRYFVFVPLFPSSN